MYSDSLSPIESSAPARDYTSNASLLQPSLLSSRLFFSCALALSSFASFLP
jgi:hypothetical protein